MKMSAIRVVYRDITYNSDFYEHTEERKTFLKTLVKNVKEGTASSLVLEDRGNIHTFTRMILDRCIISVIVRKETMVEAEIRHGLTGEREGEMTT